MVSICVAVKANCSQESDSIDQLDQALNPKVTRRIEELKLLYPKFDPLLLRFLAKLQASPIKDSRDSFLIQPGRYATCVESLKTDDEEVWSYVVDELRHVNFILLFANHELLMLT